MIRNDTQSVQAIRLLQARGMMRTRDFLAQGIAATTITRLVQAGEIARLGRGLYQLSDAEIEAGHSLAEMAKQIPRGIVCLTSALVYHELTDQLPHQIFIAIGAKDWRPRLAGVRIVRFDDQCLSQDIADHCIEGVPVRITTPIRTIIDSFRYRRVLGSGVAVAALKACLQQRRATPGNIAGMAAEYGMLPVMEPYLEAMLA